jgi:hypothetical protein
VADNALFITIAQVLSVFRISQHESGAPTAAFEAGIISHPKPYKCKIEPRSEKHRALIMKSEQDYPWVESDRAELEEVGRRMGVDIWNVSKV